MNLKERRIRAQEFFNEGLNVMDSKGHDYSQEDDAYSSFKKIANMLDIPVKKVFDFFLACKVSRLEELLKKEANNESVRDTLIDLSNYACLRAVYEEDNE